MTPSPASVLRDVRALITPPERFTQGALARHKNGKPIGPEEENAACWCVLGACRKCGGDAYGIVFDILDRAAEAFYRVDDPEYVSDCLGHAAVLKMVDLAIAMAEGE